MQVATFTIAIFAVLISAVSAAISWLSTHPRPKLAGNMTVAVHIGTKGDFNDGTAVLIHCMITNEVSEPVYAISYSLEVERRGAWLRLHRAIDFTMPNLYVGEGHWEIEMKPDNFIDRTPQRIEFGSPLLGFLLFVYPEHLSDEEVQKYRLTVSDVFSRKHQFVLDGRKSREFMNTALMDQPGFSAVDIFRLAGATVRPTEKQSKSKDSGHVGGGARDDSHRGGKEARHESVQVIPDESGH
jgi:hypothetical protein